VKRKFSLPAPEEGAPASKDLILGLAVACYETGIASFEKKKRLGEVSKRESLIEKGRFCEENLSWRKGPGRPRMRIGMERKNHYQHNARGGSPTGGAETEGTAETRFYHNADIWGFSLLGGAGA